ncbi:uncharacterized protein LOC144004736 [Festucalex cinctus]
MARQHKHVPGKLLFHRMEDVLVEHAADLTCGQVVRTITLTASRSRTGEVVKEQEQMHRRGSHNLARTGAMFLTATTLEDIEETLAQPDRRVLSDAAAFTGSRPARKHSSHIERSAQQPGAGCWWPDSSL